MKKIVLSLILLAVVVLDLSASSRARSGAVQGVVTPIPLFEGEVLFRKKSKGRHRRKGHVIDLSDVCSLGELMEKVADVFNVDDGKRVVLINPNNGRFIKGTAVLRGILGDFGKEEDNPIVLEFKVEDQSEASSSVRATPPLRQDRSSVSPDSAFASEVHRDAAQKVVSPLARKGHDHVSEMIDQLSKSPGFRNLVRDTMDHLWPDER